MLEVFISFLVGFVLALGLCMVQDTLNKVDPNLNDKNSKKDKKHYLLNDPMYPITLQQLQTFAYSQGVNVEELVYYLDKNGFAIQFVKGKNVPTFTYLLTEQTVYGKIDPKCRVKLKIMTKEYYKKTR